MQMPDILTRFTNAFAEELGRWSARAIAAGVTFLAGALLLHIV